MALTLPLSLTLTPTLTLTLTTDPSPKPTRCPPRLEEWERLEDGSVRGVLYGVAGVRDGGIRARPGCAADRVASPGHARAVLALAPRPER